MKLIFDILVYFPCVLCIIVYIHRFVFIWKSRLILLGLNFVVNPLLYLLFRITIPTLSDDSVIILSSNIGLIFDLAIFLWIYHQFNILKIEILLGIFIAFFPLWLAEWNSSNFDMSTYLALSEITIIAITFALCGYYLRTFYKHPQIDFKAIPFFWIALASIIFCISTAPSSLPELKIADPAVKNFGLGIIAMFSAITYILYAIGFWKTKDWVLNNRNEQVV